MNRRRHDMVISNLLFGLVYGHVLGLGLGLGLGIGIGIGLGLGISLGHAYKSLEGPRISQRTTVSTKLQIIMKYYIIKEVTGLAVPMIPMRETVAPNSSFA